MPQGGSVSLEALPIFLTALIFGPRFGITAGFLLGCIKALYGGFIIHPLQFLIDYPLAHAALGVSGFFRSKNRAKGLFGVLIAFLLRLSFHIVSGVIFFSEYAPVGKNVWLYSFTYNASFMVPEFVITFVILTLVFNRVRLSFALRFNEINHENK